MTGQVRPVLASFLLALAAVGCGSDDAPGGSSEPAAPPSAPVSATSTTFPSATAAPTATTLEAATASAVADGFPLLVPSELPPGWTLLGVGYGVEGRGTWFMDLTDAAGRRVSLRQALVDAPSAYFADVRSAMGSGTPPDGQLDLGRLGSWDTYESRRDPAVAVTAGEVGITSVVVTADRTSLAVFALALVDATG